MQSHSSQSRKKNRLIPSHHRCGSLPSNIIISIQNSIQILLKFLEIVIHYHVDTFLIGLVKATSSNTYGEAELTFQSQQWRGHTGSLAASVDCSIINIQRYIVTYTRNSLYPLKQEHNFLNIP